MFSSLLAQVPNRVGGDIGGLGPLGDIFPSLDPTSEAVGRFDRLISITIGIMTVIAGIWFIFILFSGAFGILASGGDKSKLEPIKIQNTHYLPIMRFILEDKERRIFRAERYCFKGSIDDWIFVGLPNKLNVLARKLVKHLGQESFYELL